MPSHKNSLWSEGPDCHSPPSVNKVNLMELMQTLSNEQVLRLIPKSAVDNLHQISNLIRSGDFNIKDVFTDERTQSYSSPSLTLSPPVSPQSSFNEPFNSEGPLTPKSSDEDKVKRPLNGFIAFRAYYQRIFSQVPQKSISALITQLWKNDPFQSRWMLISRVYSFIRDTIGKSTAKLSDFLEVAVPIMGVPAPEEYLIKLCWMYSANETGEIGFFQDAVGFQRYLTQISHFQIPNTEQDLLIPCLIHGYIPDHGDALLTKLGNNNTSFITYHGHPSRCSRNKSAYEQTLDITLSPNQLAEDQEGMGSFTMSPFQMHVSSSVKIPTVVSPMDQVCLISSAPPLLSVYFPQQYNPDFDIFNMPQHEMFNGMNGFNANGSSFRNFTEK